VLGSFPSQSPDVGDPGGVTHVIHIVLGLKTASSSMSLNRIMFHPGHAQLIQNADNCVKTKIMFDISEKSLYNNKLHASLRTFDFSGRWVGCETGFLK
jgi:hypothetical protein